MICTFLSCLKELLSIDILLDDMDKRLSVWLSPPPKMPKICYFSLMKSQNLHTFPGKQIVG